MKNAEALAFQMIERFVASLLPHSTVEALEPWFSAARRKLAEMSGRSPQASWTRKVRVVHPTQTLIPPRIERAVHRAVTEALLLDRQVEVVYRRRYKGGEPARQRVNPLALVQRGPVAYLVVTRAEYPALDPYFLALHRIQRAATLDAPAVRPPDFDLDRFIASGRFGFGRGTTIELHALFASEVAEHLRETPLSADQRMEAKDGDRTLVVATVPDDLQLRWWLLGFGEQVEVLKPPTLRKSLAETARAMARVYGDRAGAEER